MKICNIFCFLIAFLFSTNLFADTLDISVDKNILSEGDVLYLTIEYNGSSGEKPEFGHVLDDFQLVQNSSSSQYSIINGDVSHVKKWTLGLAPKKKGKITIKPIKLGDLTSNYVEVEVKELSNVAYVPDSKQNFNAPYFEIEQNIDNKTPYLNQQVLMSITILDTIGLNNGTLNVAEEAKKDWIILPLLEQPIKKVENIKGKKTNVVTFLFALFPQKSGKIELPQYFFNGEYIKNVQFGISNFSDAFALFDSDVNSLFGQSVPVKMKTSKKTIKVKPVVEGANLKDWLPLKNMKVTSLVNSDKKISVGETFNYEITLVATGTTQSLLPTEISLEVNGAKKYPEKPVFSEEIIDGNVVSIARYNTVYIPEKAGQIVIPRTTIKWFNLNTNKIEEVVVDEKILKVASNGVVSEESDDNKDSSFSEIIPEKKEANDKSKEQDKKIVVKINLKYVLLGMLVLIFWMFYRKNKNKPINRYKREVIESIKKKNYKQAKISLIEWAKIKYRNKNITNFKDIIDIVRNSEFEKQLDILNKLLYSDGVGILDVNAFIKTFKIINKNKQAKQSDNNILSGLYS